MNSDKATNQRNSLPVIGFVWHTIKLMLKSKALKKWPKYEKLTKLQIDKNEKFDLNISPRISVSEPIHLFGHILFWYDIPVIVGMIVSLIAGYLFQTFAELIHFQDLNIICKIVFLMFGFVSVLAIVAFVAFVRSLDSKYDIVGDGKYLLNSDDVMQVVEQLAWSEVEPEVEEAKWIADLLQKLWSNINIFVIRVVSSYFPNYSLEPIIGPMNEIAELKVAKLYLGANVPSLTGIHVINRDIRTEHMIIDCELTYDSDLDIEIIGKHYINFGIKWFYFKGKVRIILWPLFRDVPVVGNIGMSLLEKPKINWKFIGLLSVVNWDFLKNVFQCVITYLLRSPHSFTINVAKMIPMTEMKLREPIGLLRIEVMSARNLTAINSTLFGSVPLCSLKTDSYCKVQVEQQQMQTHVVQNDLNPEWNEEFCFLVHNSITNPIVVTVWDEQLIEDHFVGTFSIPIKDFDQNKLINGQEITVPLSRSDEVFTEQTKSCPSISFRVSWFKLSTDMNKLKVTASQARAQMPVAALSVLVDSATGLDSCTAQVRSPELRPLVKISVGNQVRVTTIKRRTGYPVWEQSHDFLLYNPKLETVYIQVIDMYYVEEKQLLPLIPINVSHLGKFAERIGLSGEGTVLGYYSIPTVHILNSHKMKIEGTFRLQGFVENAYIRLLLAIRITNFDPNVAENLRKPRTLLSQIIDTQNETILAGKLAKEKQVQHRDPKK